VIKKPVVRGESALRRRIQTIQEGIGPLVSQERLGAFLLRRIKERFDRAEDHHGTPWKPRSVNTRGDHPLLKKTGALFGAIDVLKGPGGFGINTGAGFRIGVKRVAVQERARTAYTDEYGRYMQKGSAKQNRPPRRFLGIGPLDVKAVDSLLRRELKKLVKE
jgi:hypothetical protein